MISGYSVQIQFVYTFVIIMLLHREDKKGERADKNPQIGMNVSRTKARNFEFMTKANQNAYTNHQTQKHRERAKERRPAKVFM